MEKSPTHNGTDVSRVKTSNSSLIPLGELARRLYCPEPKVNQVLSHNDSKCSLSSIPWRIHCSAWSDEYSDTNGDAKNVNGGDISAKRSLSYPPISYLDLRRKQNVAFAQEKCRDATVAMSSPLDFRKAESLFQQGLDLVPDHLDSLIGYGKLLLQNRQLLKAERTLEDALEVDPVNGQVKQLLAGLRHQKQEQLAETQQTQSAAAAASRHVLLGKKEKALTARESSAYIDALLERNLALEDNERFKPELVDEIEHEQGEEPKDGSTKRSREKELKRNRDKKRKEKQRRKKRKEKKRRRRSRRYDTSSEDDSIGSAGPSVSESSSSEPKDESKMRLYANAENELLSTAGHQPKDISNDVHDSPSPRQASSSDDDVSSRLHYKPKRRRKSRKVSLRFVEPTKGYKTDKKRSSRKKGSR